MNDIKELDDYFRPKVDALRKAGLSTLQKFVTAISILAYGCVYDAVDEYVRISESSAANALTHFPDAVIACNGDEYICALTTADLVGTSKTIAVEYVTIN